MQQRRLNELESDDLWQRGVFDRLLAPVLREHSYRNQIVFIPFESPVAKMLQLRAGIDAVVQTPHGNMLSLEVKIVRWPGVREGQPSRTHWRDFFLETDSCTIPGREAKGWFLTSQAEILLWCQCSQREDVLRCWPLPFSPLRTWYMRNVLSLPERRVENRIDGRALWTIGRLASIDRVCRDLKIEGFRVTAEGLVTDLFGKPILGFLEGEA
jgi:hypothetical protein